MKNIIAALFIAVFLALPGCTTNPTTGVTTVGVTLPHTTSPEAQIKTGADSHKAASTLATVLLKNGKITVSQAKSYSVLLHASSDTLDSAHATLVTCRKSTASTEAANPDPCAFSVLDIIKLATDGIANVKATLDKK